MWTTPVKSWMSSTGRIRRIGLQFVSRSSRQTVRGAEGAGANPQGFFVVAEPRQPESGPRKLESGRMLLQLESDAAQASLPIDRPIFPHFSTAKMFWSC